MDEKKLEKHVVYSTSYMYLVDSLMGTLKPQSNGPLYSNRVIVPNVTANPSTASVPNSHYSMWHYKSIINSALYRVNGRS